MNRKIKIIFLIFFSFVPFFCIILDIFMTILQPTETHKEFFQNLFDITIASETIYFSIWTSILTTVWATCSIINIYRKKDNQIRWAESEHVLTMIVSYQFLTFFIYTGTTLIAPSKIVGFNTWYNILKSILEHWVVPIAIIFYYFYLSREVKMNSKEYAKKIGWKNCILPIIYIVYVTMRAGFLHYHYGDFPEEHIYQPFPYKGGDPFVDKPYVWIPGYIVTAISGLLLGTLFNYLSIKSTNYFQIKKIKK
ncbi:hypothetical protein CK556_02955 [Mesoplasma chauliocola]|uniref:Uncharacterized protein n=1 Tax=Mesoplasma chauliocola TaxID=216427 RepID=A0A249SNQ9_9MOLU|nr:hypothetical protein [Mesoplasma chauliocola]ASZ09288.1 hypothetical protein CK556_02955 [Mesoplasma chauliocola]